MTHNIKILLIILTIFIQVKAKHYKLKTISDSNIAIKKIAFEKLFSKAQGVKKIGIASTGIATTSFLSYLAFNYLKKDNKEKTIEKITKFNRKDNLKTDNVNSSISSLSKKALYEGIRKGIIISIAGWIYLTQKEVLNQAKKGYKYIFQNKEHLYFLEISKNTILSLDQLKNIFSINNERCFKEEVTDLSNYFIENMENLIAIISTISNTKIKTNVNHQILNNSVALIREKTLIFIKKLDKILSSKKSTAESKSKTFFDQNDGQTILPLFKELNNQIFRLIRLSNSIISNKEINQGIVNIYED